jgi:hypothetical protein
MRKSLVLALLLQPCFVLMGTAVLAQANVEGAATAPQNSSSSLINDVAALETSAYGQPTSDALEVRVGHLELKTLGTMQSGPLRARVDWLKHVALKPYSTNPLQATGETRGQFRLRLNPGIEQRIPSTFKTQSITNSPILGSVFTAAAARELGMHRDVCACHYVHH